MDPGALAASHQLAAPAGRACRIDIPYLNAWRRSGLLPVQGWMGGYGFRVDLVRLLIQDGGVEDVAGYAGHAVFEAEQHSLGAVDERIPLLAEQPADFVVLGKGDQRHCPGQGTVDRIATEARLLNSSPSLASLLGSTSRSAIFDPFLTESPGQDSDRTRL